MARTGHTIRRRTAVAIGQRSDTRTVKPGTAGFGARLRYAFDNSMARGTSALIGWLFLITVLLVLLFAVVDLVFGLREEDLGFWAEAFQSLMHALDPGTVAGDTGTWQFLVTMLVLTIAGLFVVSALIGVISAGIDNKIADLRRGRSLVLETDHTIVLGWSSAIFTVVGELAIANESRRRPVVVVMADRDKVEMEDELRAKVRDLRGTRIVCRSGSPSDIDDLAVVRPAAARAVVVLSPDGPVGSEAAGVDADSEVIKTLLALRAADKDGTGPRVVAQLRDPANLEVARLIGRDRPGQLALLDVRETVARLVVQTARQSGAAAVYRELFDFDGDEIYFHTQHPLREATYADALLHYEALTVIGVDGPEGVVLNPPAATVVGERSLVVVAEDDSVLAGAVRSTAVVDVAAFADQSPVPPQPDHTVVIGWNERAPIVVRELDAFAAPGATLTLVATYGDPVVPPTDKLAVTIARADTTRRGVLEEHLATPPDRVIVLCYADDLDPEAADAKTLITLLHVRDILGRAGNEAPVVSEMINDRNRELAQVADIDDVVVSGEIVSLVLTQLAEDARVEPVLRELLRAEGSEVYLRPSCSYVEEGREVTWATVVASASRRGETALGYASDALADEGAGFGVIVNPPKSESVVLGAGDRVVVLAEE
ncbi:CASTOR/POLLUX-related putative ion channel [Nocardioides stalactiti]|uniref:CASTOR/POLLUX-related putative ion channel n=1 Tax=Nocardioides stalactiti TaxID=2755356 RepID=UPI001601595A|nr:potassium transporter TrkA [Nocardioides stalactiti]